MLVGRNPRTTNTFQSLVCNSFSARLLGPGRECKQICVGCQLASLLKDKLSIRRMHSLVARWPGRHPHPPPPKDKLECRPARLLLQPPPCQSLSSFVTDRNHNCSMSAETPLTGTPCQPLTSEQPGVTGLPLYMEKFPTPEQAPLLGSRIKSLFGVFGAFGPLSQTHTFHSR